ncbi:hypothetical protein Anapl_16017 [Anas platyrhynchos]|uniref:Uncharacterized protein n=1 Tax=Anas platyrhynchos TaxID=8839 RepID=R0K671_ANAPL|nr:hypothetical protein Anapl_16017 [Anas platyrhynchos]
MVKKNKDKICLHYTAEASPLWLDSTGTTSYPVGTAESPLLGEDQTNAIALFAVKYACHGTYVNTGSTLTVPDATPQPGCRMLIQQGLCQSAVQAKYSMIQCCMQECSMFATRMHIHMHASLREPCSSICRREPDKASAVLAGEKQGKEERAGSQSGGQPREEPSEKRWEEAAGQLPAGRVLFGAEEPTALQYPLLSRGTHAKCRNEMRFTLERNGQLLDEAVQRQIKSKQLKPGQRIPLN